MVCRHCGRGRPNRPRGLCWTCYYTPGVRERYAPRCHRGLEDFYGQPELPVPTRALPGTLEKVVVLEQRASRRQALWHPQDAPCGL